jgi:hypothetical protein
MPSLTWDVVGDLNEKGGADTRGVGSGREESEHDTYPGQLYCAPGCRLKSNLCRAPGTRPSDGDACAL